MESHTAGWPSAGRFRCLLALGLFWLGVVQAPATEGRRVALSLAEQRFIDQHPEVVLASGLSFEPFVIQNEDGRIGGHDAELARLISERTGLRIRLRLGVWEEMQQLAFKREVDGLATAINFETRRHAFEASRPYISFATLVFVKRGNPLGIHGIEDLAGRRAAQQRGNLLFERLLEETGQAVDVVRFDTLTEVLNAVVNDQADFAIIDESAFYLIRKLGVTRLIESAFLLDKTYELSFLLRNDWPELRSIIDKGLATITEPERRELRDYWFGSPILTPASADEMLPLSAEERAYLRSKGPLKLCIDPDWLPYEALDDEGRHQGLSADFMQLFARRLGVELSIYPTGSWSETLEAARQRHCDLVALANPTPERRTYLDFTTPYLSFPYVLITRDDQFFIEDIKQELDEVFAVVRGYALIDEMQRRYPKIRLLEVANIREGLEKVHGGEVFGYIGATVAVAHALRRYDIVGLKVAAQLPGGFALAVASRNDEPRLSQVFQKAVDSLTPEEQRRIQDKWLAVEVRRVTDYTLLWKVLGATTILLVLFAYWNRKLQHSRRQTEQALDRLHGAQQQLREQYQQLEALSVTDHLTQLYNRAKLDLALEQEIQRSRRHPIGLGVIMVDVDHFKQVNDRHGHQVGDQVLVAMAELLKRRVRVSDMVGRWGGEEFLVLCPGADLEGVRNLAEDLRLAVAEHEFPVVERKTASFGVAACQEGDSVESLVARADRALYAAKANGRNRVEG